MGTTAWEHNLYSFVTCDPVGTVDIDGRGSYRAGGWRTSKWVKILREALGLLPGEGPLPPEKGSMSGQGGGELDKFNEARGKVTEIRKRKGTGSKKIASHALPLAITVVAAANETAVSAGVPVDWFSLRLPVRKAKCTKAALLRSAELQLLPGLRFECELRNWRCICPSGHKPQKAYRNLDELFSAPETFMVPSVDEPKVKCIQPAWDQYKRHFRMPPYDKPVGPGPTA